MTMTQTQLSEALEAANAHHRATDVIEATKAAVIRELKSLDPSAGIKSTEYFNHSFAPDLIMTWKTSGRKNEERPIFLRGSIETAIIGKDLTALSHEDPVILSLNQRSATEVLGEDRKLRKRVARQAESSPYGLLTDASAMSLLTSNDNSSAAPLEELVRRSFVREARGVVDAERVGILIPSAPPTMDDEGFAEYELAISDTFHEGTSNRIRRTARIVALAQTGNLAELELMSQEDGLSLTDPEVQALLPWLLSQDDFETAPEFWAWIGSRLSLTQFERQAQAFANLDISPLIQATARTWVGKRSALVATGDEIEEEIDGAADGEDESVSASEAPEIAISRPNEPYSTEVTTDDQAAPVFEPDDYVWHVSSGMPSVRLGGLRIFVSSDQRRLTGRDSRSAARWDDVLPAFEKMTMRGVRLDGLSRRLNVSADKSESVTGDAQSIIDTIDDSFIVPTAVVADRTDLSKDITVDFGRMLASADQGASVATLTEAAIRLLGYRVIPVDAIRLTLGEESTETLVTPIGDDGAQT